MYIRLLDGSAPKFVTCTSEAAFACGAPSVTTSPSPAAVTMVTPAASSALSHLFMLCPFLGFLPTPRRSAVSPRPALRNVSEVSRLCFLAITPPGQGLYQR